MSEDREPQSRRPDDFYTLRSGLRRLWADKHSRRYLLAILIMTLLVPLILAVTLPEESGPNPGFWLDLGQGWVTQGPASFLVVLTYLFVVMPPLLWLRRRRMLKRRRPD